MATLVLIRHAKADRPPGVADFERDLTERGRRDAALVGRFLGAALATPDVILTSPANRARTTAELVADGAGWSVPRQTDRSLYQGDVDDLVDSLRSHPGDLVVAVGHNPTWSAAASLLIGGGTLSVVTGAAVCLDGPLVAGGAVLRWMITPAALGGGS